MTNNAQLISDLVKLAGSVGSLDAAQARAAAAILALDGEHFPSNSCAITQSKLFEAAGFEIEDTFLALSFVALLEKLGWEKIPAAEVTSGRVRLQPGDVGTTCYGGIRHPGVDHVYLVVKPMSEDENLIADNQKSVPHFRSIDGREGKSPTTEFLRAPQ